MDQRKNIQKNAILVPKVQSQQSLTIFTEVQPSTHLAANRSNLYQVVNDSNAESLQELLRAPP